jgi:hypothetical protein
VPLFLVQKARENNPKQKVVPLFLIVIHQQQQQQLHLLLRMLASAMLSNVLRMCMCVLSFSSQVVGYMLQLLKVVCVFRSLMNCGSLQRMML